MICKPNFWITLLVDTVVHDDDDNDDENKALITFKNRPFMICEHAHVAPSKEQSSEEEKEDEKSSSRPDRSSYNLPDDKIVLACFAQHHKIDPKMFDMISSVMKKCSRTVLWLLKWTEDGSKNLAQELVKRGISEDRVVFSDVLPRAEHLKRCYLADLYIDTVCVSSVSTLCSSWKRENLNRIPAILPISLCHSHRVLLYNRELRISRNT